MTNLTRREFIRAGIVAGTALLLAGPIALGAKPPTKPHPRPTPTPTPTPTLRPSPSPSPATTPSPSPSPTPTPTPPVSGRLLLESGSAFLLEDGSGFLLVT
jgi:hypothetical protein